MPAVQIFSVNAVCCHFILSVRHQYRNGTMLNARINCFAEKLLHLLWRSRCRNVPVGRCSSENAVAYTAADNIGLKAGLVQRIQDSARSGRNMEFPVSALPHQYAFAQYTIFFAGFPQQTQVPAISSWWKGMHLLVTPYISLILSSQARSPHHIALTNPF